MIPDDGTLITQMLQIFTDLFFRRRTLYSSQSHTKLHPYDPNIFNPRIIKQIASLGHEIGYHYETMDTVDSRHCESYVIASPTICVGRSKLFYGLRTLPKRLLRLVNKYDKTRNDEKRIDAAFSLFVQNLDRLRQIVDVKTICMHGSPRSKYDNSDIWSKYNYRKLGITGEPYFDMDFDQFFYLTDTGRRWDVSFGESIERRASEGLTVAEPALH